MDKWEKAIHNKELQPGTMVNVKIQGQNILLAHVFDKVYALKNDCPHLGCFLHKGTLEGFKLTCPCHDWTFDLRTGEFIDAPEISIPTYPVKVKHGEIYIELGGV